MAFTLADLQRNVFPGESGGDYNALLGFANQPGRQFAGTQLTDMTVDQALQFSQPGGAYANYSNARVGRTATPMGAYQVVGTTLADAKRGLGLTGSERMTPELQDRIGMWIYQNQGPGAWAAWGKSGSAAQPNTGGTGMGLLDMQQEPQTFGERLKEGWKSGALMDNLALAFNSMRLNPDQNLGQLVGARMEQRKASTDMNRTAQWLAQMGRTDLAQAVASGAIDGKSAAALALTPPAQQGSVVDAATLREKFPGTKIDDGLYSVQPDGTISKVGGGAATTTINMPGTDAYADAAGKGMAGMYTTMADEARNARADLGRIDVIEQLFNQGAGGTQAAWGQWAQQTLGLPTSSGATETVNAMINQLVPAQRAPGAGAMSDRDVELFKSSLPQLINSPEGNALILSTMRAMAQYKMAQGQLAAQALAQPDKRNEIMQQILDLPDPMADVKVLLSGAPATATAGGPPIARTTPMTPEEAARLLLSNQ